MEGRRFRNVKDIEPAHERSGEQIETLEDRADRILDG
jgi:hypothetical protein